MRSTIAVAALALTVLGACGSSSAESASGARSIEDLFDPADFAARETKVQAEVAACMKTKGWDYTPMDLSTGGFAVAMGGPVSPEDRATKGYGISTGEFAQTVDATSLDDPNAQYIESLSESDREAYQYDLYGEMPEPTGDGGGGTFVIAAGDEDPFTGNTGCFAEAQRSIPQEGPDFAELGPALELSLIHI